MALYALDNIIYRSIFIHRHYQELLGSNPDASGNRAMVDQEVTNSLSTLAGYFKTPPRAIRAGSRIRLACFAVSAPLPTTTS